MVEKPIVEAFLESHNMDYLFLLLANMEVTRLSELPYSVRSKFPKKLSEVALENVAKNDIPDFIVEQEETIDLDEG